MLLLAEHLIQEITVKTELPPHPAELSITLEEAYLRFLHHAPGDVLARLLLTLSLGIRIAWITAFKVPPRKALVVEFVETVGNFAKQSWDDWEPDRGLAHYVPDGDQSPLLSIDQYCEHWRVSLPTDLVSADGKQDFRRVQFERLIANTPCLRVLAISTLGARVDASARKKFFEIADEWLYCYWERQKR